MQKHKILAFILALVASIGLWVYAVTFVNPNDTAEISDIRVRITGTASLAADGLMITGGDAQYIDVEIAGRRSDLKELNSSSLEAIADVGNIDAPGTYEVSWTLNPPATVASGDISLVSASTNRVTVKVSERRDREIPVEIRYNKEELPAGYDLGELLYTETVSVSGPADEVGKIACAVVTVELKDRKEKINEPRTFMFEDENGEELVLGSYTTVSAETVDLMMQIMPYKDVALDIELLAGGGLTEADVTYKITPSTIRVTGTEAALAKMPDTLVSNKPIDLAKIEGLDPEAFKHAFELPEGITRWGESGVSSVTAEIDLQFSQSISILSISLEQTELRWVNGEQDKTYSCADLDQVIEIRGPWTKLRELETKLKDGEISIVAVIDIAKMDQTQMCPLKIELPADFGVGLFAEYTARIEVRSKNSQYYG